MKSDCCVRVLVALSCCLSLVAFVYPSPLGHTSSDENHTSILKHFKNNIRKRSILHSSNGNTVGSDNAPTCPAPMPCGWEAYEIKGISQRIHSFYAQNDCVCPEDKVCCVDDDNRALRAYVYKCKSSSSTCIRQFPEMKK